MYCVQTRHRRFRAPPAKLQGRPLRLIGDFVVNSIVVEGRSSMVKRATDESVKCVPVCFDEEDDGLEF